MLKGEFNIDKARGNLVKLDYICAVISGVSLLIYLIISTMIMDSDAIIVIRVATFGSLGLLVKSIVNIKKYYTKEDILYSYVKKA